MVRLIALFCVRSSTVMRTSGIVAPAVLIVLLTRFFLASLSLITGTMFAN